MALAAAEDFAAVPGVRVCVTQDARLQMPWCAGLDVTQVHTADEFQEVLHRSAARADYTVLIAPEFDGRLLKLARGVVAAGGRLLGASPEFIEAAADKHAAAQLLAAAGIATPEGIALAAGEPPPADFPYPAVLKPRDGAGSCGVKLVDRYDASRPPDGAPAPSRLERFHSGAPVSVAALCRLHASPAAVSGDQTASRRGRIRVPGRRTADRRTSQPESSPADRSGAGRLADDDGVRRRRSGLGRRRVGRRGCRRGSQSAVDHFLCRPPCGDQRQSRSRLVGYRRRPRRIIAVLRPRR